MYLFKILIFTSVLLLSNLKTYAFQITEARENCGLICKKDSNMGSFIKSFSSYFENRSKLQCTKQQLINKAMFKKYLDIINCTKTQKTSEEPKCLKEFSIQSYFNLYSERGDLGMVGKDLINKENLIIFFNSRDAIGMEPSILEAISSNIFKTAETERMINYVYDKLKKGEDVTLIGHSQGGASAQFVAYSASLKFKKLEHRLPRSKVKIVTFGSPGISELVSSVYSNQIDYQIVDSIDANVFINANDIVTRLGTQFFKFQQLDSETEQLDLTKVSNASKIGWLIENHDLTTYISNFAKSTPCFNFDSNMRTNFVLSENSLLVRLAKLITQSPKPLKDVIQRYETEIKSCYAFFSKSRAEKCEKEIEINILTKLRDFNPTSKFVFDPMN